MNIHKLTSRITSVDQAPETIYNKQVTSQSESNTTATYMLRGKLISVSKQGI